ncbi:hypothetical protein DRQ17_00595 [bacterium]|nr:MAG: hypothetical protein DRQ17_00595 [bacterium]
MTIFLLLSILAPSLQTRLGEMKGNDSINILIRLPSADYSYAWALKKSKGDWKSYLKEFTSQSQAPIIEFLKKEGVPQEKITQLWIANKIGVRKLQKTIILKLEDKFGKDILIRNDEPVKVIPDVESVILSNFYPGEDYVSGSMENIKAPIAWERGYRGNGIVIGHMDTGMDYYHPVLRHRWRKQGGWHDEFTYNPSDVPYDDEGHGTGTAGFAVGEHGIGAAPGAQIIVCKALDSLGRATETQLSNGMQWFCDLPDSLKPDLTTNSWGYAQNDTRFWDEIQTMLLDDIIPVFAVGNEGPDANTTSCPGEYPMVIGVGATYWDEEWIAWYSSRGPEPNQSPWNNTNWWPRPDWNRHKPDIIAPAEPTYTSAPDGNFQSFNGTSAATPHAAGLIADILQANTFGEYQDTARIRRLYQYLTDYAYLNGDIDAWPNDSFGWGRIDAEKVLNNLPAPEVPHIFISSVVVEDGNNGVLGGGDGNPHLRITLKNTGAPATNVSAKLVYKDNSSIRWRAQGPFSFGNLGTGDSASNNSFQLRMPATLDDTLWVYFTLRITADGGYQDWDFFHLVTDFSNKPGYEDTLVNDDDTPTYNTGNDDEYANYNYFASSFEVASPCTLIAIQLYFDGTGTGETLFVWKDNSANNAPDSELWGYAIIDVGTADAWTTVDVNPDIYIGSAGRFWVGIRKVNSTCVPWQDDNYGVNPPYDLSTNDRTDPTSWWGSSWWGTFMWRPIVKTEAITKPFIRSVSCNIKDKLYGNDDGWIDPGEKLGLYISLKNNGIPCYNTTLTLEPANTYTSTRVNIIDNTSTVGIVQTGDETANNYNDPWVIRFWDLDSLKGRTLTFRCIVQGSYGSGSTYNDTFTFDVDEPWQPTPGDTLFYSAGTGGLVAFDICSYNFSSWYFATDFYIGNTELDSVYVESIGLIYWSKSYMCNNSKNPGEFDAYIWADNNGLPGAVLWSQSSDNEVTDPSWQFFYVGMRLPGRFWVGYKNTATRVEGLQNEYNYPLNNASPLIASVTAYNDGSGWGLYVDAPMAAYVFLREDHPTVSYFRPSGWDWSVLPTNATGTHTIPSNLSGSWVDGSGNVYTHLALINRSPVDISTSSGTARETWENYCFLDNYSVWYGTATNLNAYTSLTYSDQSVYVPGGRHTLLMWADYNDNVQGNVFNVSYRYWGKQYNFRAPVFPVDTSVLESWIPPMTGPFAGYLENCTAYKLNLTEPRWYVFGVRDFNINVAGDTFDVDLKVYSDGPTDPYTGYSHTIGASALGPGMVDFVVMDGRNIDSVYVGIYNFLDSRDSAYVNLSKTRYRFQSWSATRVGQPDSFNYSSDVVKVYELAVPTTATYACSVVNTSGSDLGIGVYYGNNVMGRSKGTESDVNGAGGDEGLSLSLNANDTIAIVVWKNDNVTAKGASFTVYIKNTGTDEYASAAPLATHSMYLSYSITMEGVVINIAGNGILSSEIYRSEDNQHFSLIGRTGDCVFLDADVDPGRVYWYRVKSTFEDGHVETRETRVIFNPIDKLSFAFSPASHLLNVSVPSKMRIELSLFDITGRKVLTLIDGKEMRAGIYRYSLGNLASGLYFVVLRGENKRILDKVVILK